MVVQLTFGDTETSVLSLTNISAIYVVHHDHSLALAVVVTFITNYFGKNTLNYTQKKQIGLGSTTYFREDNKWYAPASQSMLLTLILYQG